MTRNAVPHNTAEKRTMRMTVEYDGSRYVGWQRQRNGLSVQEVIEDALSKQLREQVRVTAAGRTDSGVHAMGQVISFHTASRLSPHAVLRGTMPHLPSDVALLDCTEAPPDFSARRSARLRWYKFFICNRSVAPAIARKQVTYVPFRLNLDKMHEVAQLLAGSHDFQAFRSVNCTATRTVLDMHEPIISRLPNHILMLDFRCQSFLQNMVRIMAGVLVTCARGRMQVSEVRTMLSSGKRANDAVTLAPNGLFLYRVVYSLEELQAITKESLW